MWLCSNLLVCLAACLCIYLPTYLPMLPIYISAYLLVCLSVCLFICHYYFLSICLPAWLCVYLSVICLSTSTELNMYGCRMQAQTRRYTHPCTCAFIRGLTETGFPASLVFRRMKRKRLSSEHIRRLCQSDAELLDWIRACMPGSS